MSVTALPERLSAQQLASYEADGFIVPALRLSPAELAEFCAAIERLRAANPERAGMPLTAAHVRRDGSPHGVRSDGSLMAFCAHPAILDLLESLIGPDIILWQSTLFHKPAQVGSPSDWHQDSEYIPITPMQTVNVWIAATESNRDNGGLRVYRGSHVDDSVAGLYRSRPGVGEVFDRYIDHESLDAARVVDIDLEPGQMLIFDVKLVHGALANRSGRPRTAFVSRYMPATSFFDHDGGGEFSEKRSPFETNPLYLLRGRDRAGNDLKRNHRQDS